MSELSATQTGAVEGGVEPEADRVGQVQAAYALSDGHVDAPVAVRR